MLRWGCPLCPLYLRDWQPPVIPAPLAPSVDPLELGLSPARNASSKALASPYCLSVWTHDFDFGSAPSAASPWTSTPGEALSWPM